MGFQGAPKSPTRSRREGDVRVAAEAGGQGIAVSENRSPFLYQRQWNHPQIPSVGSQLLVSLACLHLQCHGKWHVGWSKPEEPCHFIIPWSLTGQVIRMLFASLAEHLRTVLVFPDLTYGSLSLTTALGWSRTLVLKVWSMDWQLQGPQELRLAKSADPQSQKPWGGAQHSVLRGLPRDSGGAGVGEALPCWQTFRPSFSWGFSPDLGSRFLWASTPKRVPVLFPSLLSQLRNKMTNM